MRHPLDLMRIRPEQFGRPDPVSNTFGMVRARHTRAHQGWDLLASPGTPLYAIAPGKLTAGSSGGGYGEWLLLEFAHASRTLYAFHAHLQSASLRNCSVPEGALIGFTGRSGNARDLPLSEAHLHFEIRTRPDVGGGLDGRIDPGQILGFRFYAC